MFLKAMHVCEIETPACMEQHRSTPPRKSVSDAQVWKSSNEVMAQQHLLPTSAPAKPWPKKPSECIGQHMSTPPSQRYKWCVQTRTAAHRPFEMSTVFPVPVSPEYKTWFSLATWSRRLGRGDGHTGRRSDTGATHTGIQAYRNEHQTCNIHYTTMTV